MHVLFPEGRKGYVSFSYEATDSSDTAVLTVSLRPGKHDVTGSVHYADGRVFTIENCGGTDHVWIQQNTAQWNDGKYTY